MAGSCGQYSEHLASQLGPPMMTILIAAMLQLENAMLTRTSNVHRVPKGTRQQQAISTPPTSVITSPPTSQIALLTPPAVAAAAAPVATLHADVGVIPGYQPTGRGREPVYDGRGLPQTDLL